MNRFLSFLKRLFRKETKLTNVPDSGFIFYFGPRLNEYSPLRNKIFWVKNRIIISSFIEDFEADCNVQLIYKAATIYDCNKKCFVKSRREKYKKDFLMLIKGKSSKEIEQMKIPHEIAYNYIPRHW